MNDEWYTAVPRRLPPGYSIIATEGAPVTVRVPASYYRRDNRHHLPRRLRRGKK
jgi:hypothetical protein